MNTATLSLNEEDRFCDAKYRGLDALGLSLADLNAYTIYAAPVEEGKNPIRPWQLSLKHKKRVRRLSRCC